MIFDKIEHFVIYIENKLLINIYPTNVKLAILEVNYILPYSHKRICYGVHFW